MIKYVRAHMSRPIVLWVIFLMLLFFLIARPGISAGESTVRGIERNATMTVSGKTRSSILVFERHFRLTETTTILDRNGKTIGLEDLPVPCKADVTYLLRMDQDPLALKVLVREVFPDSSTVYVPHQ